MPTFADLVVKKYDESTDITYTGVVAASGDKSQAVWRSQTIGTAVAHQPELRISSRPNGTGTARRVEWQYSYPEYVTGADNIVRLSERFVASGSFVLPLAMTSTVSREGSSQLGNLLAKALVKEMTRTGYAAT